MERTHTKDHFKTEEEAIAEIKAAGFHPYVIDIPATENDFHYHDFDAMTYVVSGGLVVTIRDTGEVFDIKAGDRSTAPAGLVHRERHDGFRAVFGFSVPAEELPQPIEVKAD